MKRSCIKILIADDHELFRKGFISLLLKEPGIKIIGEANNGKDLVYKFFKLKPDLIITDISMPETSGMEAVKTLYEQNKNIKVIFLSMFSGEDYIYHCIKAGGSSLINKDISKAELLKTITLVTGGEKYFGDYCTSDKIEEFVNNYEERLIAENKPGAVRLTDKESEIILLIAEGLTSLEIAEKLFISKRTVDTHRINLMQKLSLKSFPQLMKYAINYSALVKQETETK